MELHCICIKLILFLFIGEEFPKPPPPFCGNVFTRFLPVIDIVIHRLIEVPPDAAKSLDNLIQQICPLYKYHPKPIMFLYTTLHYYELSLVNRPILRANLVSSIMGALQSIHPPVWYFTREFIGYLASNEEVSEMIIGAREGPDVSMPPEYWFQLLHCIKNAVSDPHRCECWTDWRFSEFQTPAAKFLTCTAVEVLTLPNSPTEVCLLIPDFFIRYSLIAFLKFWFLWTPKGVHGATALLYLLFLTI